jgi:hypothetical protein
MFVMNGASLIYWNRIIYISVVRESDQADTGSPTSWQPTFWTDLAFTNRSIVYLKKNTTSMN